MLPLHPGPFRNERRRDHVARVAPFPHRPVDDITRATRFVARAEVSALSQPLEVSSELREIIGQPVESRRCSGLVRQDRDGDGLLVHIHPEVDDRASSGNNFGN